MRIVDTWFKFPVRMFDEAEMKRADVIEDTTGEIPEVDYVVGWKRIPYNMVYDIQWNDSYTRSLSQEEIKEQGCDITIIKLADGSEYVSQWRRKEFEEKFNSYLEKVEAYYAEKEKQEDNLDLTEE